MELQNWSQQWYLTYCKHRHQRMCFSAGYSRLYYYVHTHWGWDIWMLSQQSVFFYFVFQNNSTHKHTHTHILYLSLPSKVGINREEEKEPRREEDERQGHQSAEAWFYENRWKPLGAWTGWNCLSWYDYIYYVIWTTQLHE